MKHPKIIDDWRRLMHPVQRWPAPDARWEKVEITEAKRLAEMPPYWHTYVEVAILGVIVVGLFVGAAWYVLG